MKKEMRLIVKTLIDFFFFALYMWRLKMYRIATSSFLFKRLIENYIRLVRYSVLSVAFIADHICLRQRIKQFHASSSESLG